MWRALKTIVVCAVFVLIVPILAGAQEDLRVYQHGIDIVEFAGRDPVVVWSSAGNPPIDDWIHDVYTATIDRSNPSIRPVKLFANEEAQEPASAAVNSDGHVLVTVEDGWNAENEIAQRYGVYSSSLSPIRPYPALILDGGHSGHVAAVGSRFVVFFSEGWVDGGGVDDLGSGDEVYAAIISSDGTLLTTVPVAVGDSRDWWPLVAGSPSRAALVWQRYVDGATHANLMLAILDPATGALTSVSRAIASGVAYYTYDVAYVDAIERFVVMGTKANGHGFAYLVDEQGAVTAEASDIPPIVREGQVIARGHAGGATLVYPVRGGGIAVLDATRGGLTFDRRIEGTYVWQYMGTTGVFLDDTHVYIASLSTRGVVGRTFMIEKPASAVVPVVPVGLPTAPVLPAVVPLYTHIGTTSLEVQLPVVPSESVREVPTFCQLILPPGRASYAFYFVEPFRTYTPTAHWLLAARCASE